MAGQKLPARAVDTGRMPQSVASRAVAAPRVVELGSALAGARRLLSRDVRAGRQQLETLHRAAPRHPGVLHWLGVARFHSGDPAAAVESLRAALELTTDSAETWRALGAAYSAQGAADDALRAFQRGLSLEPRSADLLAGAAWCHASRAELAQAEACLRRALCFEPDHLPALHGLASALFEQGCAERAAGVYARMAWLDPSHPNARLNLSRLRLVQGRFAEGWSDYLAWRLTSDEGLLLPAGARMRDEWRGQSVAGRRVLVHCEQGLGDSLQFVRYLPWLAAQGADIVLFAPEPLRRLFGGLDGVEQLIGPGEPLPPHDLQVPLMSLPALHGSTEASLPAEFPYLDVDPALQERWRARLPASARLRVGLCWRGNPRNARNGRRSLSLSELVPLLAADGAEFYSLQLGPSEAERRLLAEHGVRDLSPDLNDLADTAAAIRALDVVVSVCTSVAHLAGALGAPLELLLSAAADWRWLREREDSPWYPTARLHRQTRLGDWSGPVTRVRLALEGRRDASAASARRAEATRAANQRSRRLFRAGDLAAAEAELREAAALCPDDAALWSNLSHVVRRDGRLAEASDLARHALALAPDHADAHNNLAAALIDTADLDGALAHVERAAAAAPDDPQVLYNWSYVLEYQNRLEAALEQRAHCAALAHSPKVDVGVETLRARLEGRAPDAERLEAIRARAVRVGDHAGQVAACFALGEAYDALGETDRAFARVAEGNACERAVSPYDVGEAERLMEAVRARFSPGFVQKHRDWGDREEAPIFIVGMPRSGSSVVEQILTTHPEVEGAGETPALANTVLTLSDRFPWRGRYPDCVAELRETDWAPLGRAYRETLRTRHGLGAPRTTDKMLANFLYVGVILLALPEARIIHTLRDPRDTCFGCFRQNFSRGHLFSHDLGDLGRFHRSYERLMAYWHALFPQRVLDLSLEALVDGQERETRRLLAFCGLSYDARCLRFHESDRNAVTASHVQVRRPLNRAGIGRWRRYEEHLGPLLEALEA